MNVSPRAEHPVFLVIRRRPLHVLQELLLQVGNREPCPSTAGLLLARRNGSASGDHVPHMQAKEPVVTPQHWELGGARAFTDSLASGNWMADKLVRSRIPMHGATFHDPSRAVTLLLAVEQSAAT